EKPQVHSCFEQLDHVEDLVHDQHGSFTLALLDSLFSKGLRTVKSIPPKCRLGFSRALKGALDKVICKPDDISCWVSLLVLPLCLHKTFCPRSNLECKSAIKRQRQEDSIVNAIRSWSAADGSLQVMRETLAEPSHPIVLSSSRVALYNDATIEDLKIKHPFKPVASLPLIPSDNHHLIASPSVILDRIKSLPRGTSCGQDGLRAQHLMDYLSGAVVVISDELVSFITQVVNLFLDGKCPKMLGEYIVSALLTSLVKPGGGIRLIAIDGLQFGAGVSGGGEAIFHVVNRLIEGRGVDVDDGTIIGDTLVVGKVLELIMEDGPRCGLHLNVDKTEGFWPKKDPRSRLEGVFPPNISWPLHGVKLLGGPASMDFDFSIELVKKRVTKTIRLMDTVAKINDPQCELLLLRACMGISKLYFAMLICPPCFFEIAQRSFDVALRSALERIVTAYALGFGDWQWRLSTLPFAFEGLGVYCGGDVLNYAFLALRLQSAGLHNMLLRHANIVDCGPTFNDALCAFNMTMETGLLSNPSDIAAPKLMKKLSNIYFTRVIDTTESTFSLSPRHMALWKSQAEDHTSDWLRAVPISGLRQTMNACLKVFVGDIYGDHVVSCADVIGIKHRPNVVRDTLVDICYQSGPHFSCGSSPLTQTGMTYFVFGRAVIDAAQRKRVKYMAKCVAIGYGFLLFSFSFLVELEEDAVTLLKWIRKFPMA
ncbi:hypothetical protein Tco_1299570, partial [Tanacetum coccineum]